MQCTIYCFIEGNSNKYVPNKLYCLTKGGDVGNKHMECTIYCFIEGNSNKYVPNKLYCLTKGGDVGNKHMQSCIQFCLILGKSILMHCTLLFKGEIEPKHAFLTGMQTQYM